MILGTNKRTKLQELPRNLRMNYNTLELVLTYKYLGLTMNNQLTFKEHTERTINFVSYRINSLNHF